MEDHVMNKLTVLPFSAPSPVGQCPSSSGETRPVWHMQYSNLGLTNYLCNCKIISSDLQVKVLLIIASILLAAFAAFKHCLLHFKSLVIIIPKSRSSWTASRDLCYPSGASFMRRRASFPFPIRYACQFISFQYIIIRVRQAKLWH